MGIASASPFEVTLVEATFDQVVTLGDVEVLLDDASQDSDGLDARLQRERGVA